MHLTLLSQALTILNACFQLVSSGTLRAQFDQHSKIDVLDFVTTSFNEYVPRASLKNMFSPYNSPEEKSPKQSKVKQQQPNQLPASSSVTIPESQVNSFGVTDAVSNFLEVRYPFFVPSLPLSPPPPLLSLLPGWNLLTSSFSYCSLPKQFRRCSRCSSFRSIILTFPLPTRSRS